MIVYVDMIFLENFILDLIVLLTTKIICNSKSKIIKLILGGSIGGLYSVITIVLDMQNMLFNIGISFVLVLVSFGYKNRKYFIKHIGVFYLTAIVFSGASSIFVNMQSIYMILICGIGLGFVLIILVQKILKRKAEKTCNIEISYKGKLLKTKALIDSRKFIKRKINKFTGCYCRRGMLFKYQNRQ